MSNSGKSSFYHVIATLGCIGVAAATSIAGGPISAGTWALAGKMSLDLFNGLSINIASDQLLKIDTKSLRRWWTNAGADISNHDLYKALKQSLVMALQATERSYNENIVEGAGAKKAIGKKIKALCQSVEEEFDQAFIHSVTDESILNFIEGYDARLYEDLEEFVDSKEFPEEGARFFIYFKQQFPLYILAAFAEILKSNSRVWVAYQRLLLTDLQQSANKIDGMLTEVSNQVTVLVNQLQVMENTYGAGSNAAVDYLWEQFGDLRAYLASSQQRLVAYQEEFALQLTRIQQDMEREFAEQQLYRQTTARQLEELLSYSRRLLKQQASKEVIDADIEIIEKKVLPVYLEWMIQEFETINLPAIQEEHKLFTIPLERVYVSLQLTDEKTYQEIQSGSQIIYQRIKEQEARTGRILQDEEREGIRAEVLQKNKLVSSFSASAAEVGEGGIGDISLAQIFQDNRYAVILGDPGSGKSTLIRWLALQLARGMKACQQGGQKEVFVPSEQIHGLQREEEAASATVSLGPVRLPVVIKVSEYTNFYEKNHSRRGIIDYCGFHLPTTPDIDPEFLQQLIKYYLINGQAVILLDGMDEVVKNRDKVIDEIESFIRLWINRDADSVYHTRPLETGGNQIIITSRIVGYHAAPLRSKFPIVYVRRMDRKSIEAFCRLWVKYVFADNMANMTGPEQSDRFETEHTQLTDAIFDDSKPRVRELATNPLMITILALLYQRQNKELPKNRVELYEQAVGILVGKWQRLYQPGEGITNTEIYAILQVIASRIHSSPSEDITETELRETLVNELRILRGIAAQESTPTLILHQAENFIRIIREDVGLLSERGEKLYHFLHRTFQEYLAAQRLVAHPDTAIRNIVDHLSDPVWREPVLMAIAYANKNWSSERFNRLIESLLITEDQLKDLVPRGILLVATALPELSKLSPELFKNLVREFLSAFGNQDGIGRYPIIRSAIKSIIDNLRKSDRREAFLDACEQLLKEHQYRDPQWALISLSAKDGWYKPDWIDYVIDHLPEDSPKWDWPIDHLLAREFAGAEQKPTHIRMRFREKLQNSPEFVALIQADPDWQRLLMVLYGGWISDTQVDEYKKLHQKYHQLLTKSVNMETEGYQIAVKMDTELGKMNHFRKNYYAFSPDHIHRESPFTLHLLRHLAAKAPAAELVPFFRDTWLNKSEGNEKRTFALLALAALGENVALIVYEITEDPDATQAAIHFLDHLNRLERNLSFPAMRLAMDMLKPENLRALGWTGLPVEKSTYAWSILCQTVASFGLPPRKSFPGISVDQIYPEERQLMQQHWPNFVLREAESYAALVSFLKIGDEAVYQASVMLDTTGKHLRRGNGQIMLDALCAVPLTSNIRNPFQQGWEMPAYWLTPHSEVERLTFAIQVIAGLSKEFDFLCEFFVSSLWKRFDAYPDLKIFALSLFINRKMGTLAGQLVEKHFGKTDLAQAIYIEAEKMSDPYIQFLTAFQINKQLRTEATDKILLKSFKKITRPTDWINAFMWLQKKEVLWLLVFRRASDQALVGQVLDFRYLLGGENPENLILEKAREIENVSNRIRAYIFATDLAAENRHPELVFGAMDLIPQLANDQERAESLQFILDRYQPVATHYPHWKNINGAFRDVYHLNRGLSKDYNNLIELQQYIVADDKPQATSIWSAFSLLRLTQDLRQRFKEKDINGVLAKRIVEKKAPDQALAEFLERNKSGFGFNSRYVRLIDELVQRGEIQTVLTLLSLLEARDNGVLSWTQHWAKSDVSELRLFFDLLQAETGVLNISILNSLIDILKSFPDRLRYRAAVAIHGENVANANEDRIYSAHTLGLDVLLHWQEKLAEVAITHPEIATILFWGMHNLVFDSPEQVGQVVMLHLTGEAKKKKYAEEILRDMERASPAVIEEMFVWLKKTAPSSGWILWPAIVQLTYNYRRFSLQQFLLLSNFIEEALLNDNAVASLLRMEEEYIISDIPVVGQALLYCRDQEGSFQDKYRSAREEAQRIGKTNFKAALESGITQVLSEIERLGNDFYYRESTVESDCKLYAGYIGNNVELIKILIKWTFDQLETEIISNMENRSSGGDLCLLLSEVAANYPETFETLVDRRMALNLLPEVVLYHRSYTARKAAIELLAQLKLINKTVLDAIVKSLQDIDIVRRAAIKRFDKFTEIVDKDTILKLKQYLQGNSAQVAVETVKILSNISAQAALDLELRKAAIDIIADCLREQLHTPSRKKFLYSFSIDGGGITYVGELEQTLYDELIKLAGL